jgi:hypothetical protein
MQIKAAPLRNPNRITVEACWIWQFSAARRFGHRAEISGRLV